MLSEMELLIISKSIESFENIINQIHSKFEEFKYRDVELVLEVAAIAKDYRNDVLKFHRVIEEILVEDNNPIIRSALIIVESKLDRLSSMIEFYTPTTFFEEPITQVYS